ncbi:Uncharacterised protein [Candidatus Norongarragalina meridionalis]|nr:Uncharacterised protein [Candidatus Norongarragalina meridionalis]
MFLALLFLASAVILGVSLSNIFFAENKLFYGIVLGVFFSSWVSFVLAFILGVSALNVICSSLILLFVAFLLFHNRSFNYHSLFSFKPWLIFVVFLFFTTINLLFTFQNSPSGILTILPDTDFHYSVTASFALGTNFPPVYPFLSAEPLTYYFLFDFFSAILAVGGLDLLSAFITYNVLIQTSLVFLLFSLSKKVVGDSAWAKLSLFLILFAGSLYFFEALGPFGPPEQVFYSISTTQRWDSLGYAFFPNAHQLYSRSFLMGIAISLICFEWLFEGRKPNLFLASLIGLLPLFHASFVPLVVSFFAFGAVSVLKKEQIEPWAKSMFAVAFLSLPQIIYLTTNKSIPLAFHFGWTNSDAGILPGLFNVVKNFAGPLFLFFVGVFAVGSGRRRNLLFCFSLPFLLGILFEFSPWSFDNIKMFAFWALVSAIFGVLWFRRMWEKNSIWSKALLIFLLFAITISGFFTTLGFLLIPSPSLISKTELPVCDFIKTELPPNAIILTSGEKSCAYITTGRKVFFAENSILFTHAVNNLSKRLEENIEMLGGNCYLLKKYGIDYYYAGGYSPINELKSTEKKILEKSVLIFQNQGNKLYKINC